MAQSTQGCLVLHSQGNHLAPLTSGSESQSLSSTGPLLPGARQQKHGSRPGGLGKWKSGSPILAQFRFGTCTDILARQRWRTFMTALIDGSCARLQLSCFSDVQLMRMPCHRDCPKSNMIATHRSLALLLSLVSSHARASRNRHRYHLPSSQIYSSAGFQPRAPEPRPNQMSWV